MVDCSKQLTIGTRNPETKIRINIHTYIHTYMCIGRILHTNTGGRNIGQTLFLVSAAALSLYTVMEPSEFTYLFPSTSCEDTGNSLNGADLIWIFIIFNVFWSSSFFLGTHMLFSFCTLYGVTWNWIVSHIGSLCRVWSWGTHSMRRGSDCGCSMSFTEEVTAMYVRMTALGEREGW